MDYKKLGLICGIEIHQRLDTKHKLFCKCRPQITEEEAIQKIIRKLRAVPGELGDVDPAALYEYFRGKTFIYDYFSQESCLVELDEEPPHPVNPEAIEIALMIAEMLKLYIPDEVHVMRKTVIDGSNTSGFQRTMNIGIGRENSLINTKYGPVRIKDLELEEESSGIIQKTRNRMMFRLDRLGIPLVEIGTYPDIHHPDQAREVAETLGMICRMTGKVQRGLGTIRQDVNVSVKGGARIEIKGLQDLRLVAKLVENEVQRQKILLEIKNILEDKGLKEIKEQIIDATDLFKNTNSKLIKNILKEKGRIIATELPKFKGLMKKIICEKKTLAKELVDYCKAHGVQGFIHTDEDLSNYKLETEFENLKKKIKATDEDVVLIIAGEENQSKEVAKVLLERARQCLVGVPEETRFAQDDGTTIYARPLPGSARMYPETDIQPVTISAEILKKIKENLPEMPDEKANRFIKEYKLPKEMATQIIHSHSLSQFEELLKKYDKIKASIIANTLLSVPSEIKKKHNLDPDLIQPRFFNEVLGLLQKNKIAKEGITDVIAGLIKNPKVSALKIAEQRDLLMLPKEKVREIIKKLIGENKDFIEKKGKKAFMGIAMKNLKGKADGKLVNEIINELLK
ncbi:MAG: Glu-tRNA(Gln) amidotransferase subunit GatE [Candidatus Helarchaeota archaeon]|nr:Glu-tRNA(Gln) amidotransferase subunit GatE [Candidatus Helarchaeota archaeon]